MFLTFVIMKTARILATITALIAAAALTFSSCDGFNFSFINHGNETPEENGSGNGNGGSGNGSSSGTTETPDPDHFWDPVVIDTDCLTKINFSEYDGVIANPERGFYRHCAFNSSSDSYSVKTLQGYRTGSDQCTVVLFIFWMKSYITKDISESYLKCMSTAFENARKAGVKAVVRFGYLSSFSEKKWASYKPVDPTPEVLMRHIEQIKPILQANSDVIVCLQAGFIGAWGEWYYTDNYVYQPESDSDYQPRRDVLNALLDALPESRQVAVRTPTFKLELLRLSAKDTLTCATAYQNTPKARVCGHNDCFVAAEDDWGTFDGDAERRFWEDDTKYTFMGGETCAVSDYSGCNNAVKQMELQHWTYLNKDYEGDVLGSWSSGGCMNDVKKRLGYRLVLRNAWISPEIKAGSNVRTVYSIENVGFAAPINPRGLELVLVDSKGNTTVIPVTNENPRLWLAGKTRLFEVDFEAPAKGSYTLYLNLPDPEETLHDNPLYSIRLANKNVWEESTGYNKITTFEVK